MRYLDVIQESLDYIESNLKTDITVVELSKRAGFSLFHYYRLFQQAVGLPVKQYIGWRRLLWAAYEMANGKKQVEAALEYGFDTSAGLYKAFQRTFGCSPSVYVGLYKVRRPYQIHLLQENLIMIGHGRIKEVLKNWDIDAKNICNKVYSGSGEINPNVFIIDENYVLKVFQVAGKANSNVLIQLALKEAELQEVLPIPTKQGDYLASDGELHYMLTQKIDGEEIRVSDLYVGDSYQNGYHLGEVIGRLHQVLKDNDQIVCNERNIYEEVRDCWLKPAREVMDLQEDFCREYIEFFGKLHEQLPVQMIHRDPNPSNIMMKDGKCVGFIDFDLSQRSIRLFDPCYAATGILLDSFEQDPEHMLPKWKTVFQGLMHGYDSAVHLTSEEKEAIPYVIFSIQLICVGYFSTQEKFEKLKDINAAMLNWLIANRKDLIYLLTK